MGSNPQDSGMVLMDLKAQEGCLTNQKIYRVRDNAIVSAEQRPVQAKYPAGGLRNLSVELSINRSEAIIEVLLR